jgi:CubicO group peptidase (beta-lactamase class C family)
VPFEEVMRERVLAPLGMVDTAFHAADTSRLATSYENVNGELTVRDRPDGQWSRPPRFPDGAAGLVSTAEDLLRFGRMLLLPGGNPVLTAGTVAEMTSDQLTPAQLARVWPGFSFLGDRGWGYGVSVSEWGYSWEGGSGTAWANVPDQDLTVVVLTQRGAEETGLPAVCDEVRTAMSS